jgi:hypothetical protein
MMMGMFALFLVSMIISQYYNTVNQAALAAKRKTEYGWLHFSGKVAGYKVYRYMNKNFYKICVKLDSANKRPFFLYNDDDAINIKDGIAIFSAGYLNHTLGPADSVAINMDNSDKIELYYPGNVLDKRKFAFEPMGLVRTDLTNRN